MAVGNLGGGIVIRIIDRQKLVNELWEGRDLKILDVSMKCPKAHIPGSLCVPVNMIKNAAGMVLKKSESVIVYCSNQHCTEKDTAASMLNDMGYSVEEYEGGLEDWQRAGMPIEKD